ncbi:MAG TPA: metalloregulator ArsR/SmtB family transcription factor [Actinomycetales bacterium]|nr:metalloregulator ArsR/SmtB family transcription factor [Actinomycetales bacterium]
MPMLRVRDQTAPAASAASLFRRLGDPARLTILRHLTLGEHRVVDLTQHLGLAQSTVSQHLACLRECGLVTCRAQGRSSVYSMAAEPELLDLLAAAEQLLRATGDAPSECRVDGGTDGGVPS